MKSKKIGKKSKIKGSVYFEIQGPETARAFGLAIDQIMYWKKYAPLSDGETAVLSALFSYLNGLSGKRIYVQEGKKDSKFIYFLKKHGCTVQTGKLGDLRFDAIVILNKNKEMIKKAKNLKEGGIIISWTESKKPIFPEEEHFHEYHTKIGKTYFGFMSSIEKKVFNSINRKGHLLVAVKPNKKLKVVQKVLGSILGVVGISFLLTTSWQLTGFTIVKEVDAAIISSLFLFIFSLVGIVYFLLRRKTHIKLP